MGLVLIILLLVLLLGGLPVGVYGSPYAIHFGGGLGLLLVIVLILAILGRI